jgi:YesN/AraC family two-component response regulator
MTGKPKLLLVDDERDILEFLVRVFRDCDCETALNAQSALEVLRKGQFDVLVTDIKMPGGSGLSLIETAKTNWPDISIIVITGHYQEMPAGIDKKVHQWIVKPFSVQSIRDAVMSSLKNH